MNYSRSIIFFLQLLLKRIKNNKKIKITIFCLPIIIWYAWFILNQENNNDKFKTNNCKQILSNDQLGRLKMLPDLSRLIKKDSNYINSNIKRNIFSFDKEKVSSSIQSNIQQVPVVMLTKQQLEIEEIEKLRNQERNTWPMNLRYLGHFGKPSFSKLGAFVYGENAITLKKGEILNSHWQLIEFDKTTAIFQNVKFQDIRYLIEAKDITSNNRSNETLFNRY